MARLRMIALFFVPLLREPRFEPQQILMSFPSVNLVVATLHTLCAFQEREIVATI